MKTKLNPIGFANGDGGTGRVAAMARELIFGNFPTVDVPLTVESRLDTRDLCIETAVKVFQQCGAGFKNSTASNDKRIIAAGMKSANIIMRPMSGAFALLRMLQGPGRYENICGALRYAYGGIYDEQSCVVKTINNRRVAVITQHLDLDGLVPFTQLAIEQAKNHGLHLMLSSKKTIAESELLFYTEIKKVLDKAGFVEGEAETKDGKIWTGDWHHELTDIAIASLPVELADGLSHYAKGNFLHIADNANGDTASDVIDLQHGNRVMGSQVHCVDADGNLFTYEELPGGTADKMATGSLNGNNFLNPVGINFALCASFEKVNPEHKPFFNEVRRLSLDYVLNVPTEQQDTEVMLNQIAETVHSMA